MNLCIWDEFTDFKKIHSGKKQFYCILLEMNFGVILLLGDCVYYDKQLCRLKSTSRLESHMIITKVIRSPVSLKSQFFQRPLHDYVVLFFLEVDVTWDFPYTNTSSFLLWSKGQEYSLYKSSCSSCIIFLLLVLALKQLISYNVCGADFIS